MIVQLCPFWYYQSSFSLDFFGVFLRIYRMNSTQKTTDEYLANTSARLCENIHLYYVYVLDLIVPWIGILLLYYTSQISTEILGIILCPPCLMPHAFHKILFQRLRFTTNSVKHWSAIWISVPVISSFVRLRTTFALGDTAQNPKHGMRKGSLLLFMRIIRQAFTLLKLLFAGNFVVTGLLHDPWVQSALQ